MVAQLVKNTPANAGDAGDSGSILGLGRAPGNGSSNPLQYSCLENPMDRGAWWASVHSVTKSRHSLATEEPSEGYIVSLLITLGYDVMLFHCCC